MREHQYSDHPILNEFLDEEPTHPIVQVRAVQAQLDTAESLTEELIAGARALGYSVDPPKHWTERVEASLQVEQPAALVSTEVHQ